MTWHIVTQIGPEDVFHPDLPASEPRLVVGIDKPGAPTLVTNDLFRNVQRDGYQVPTTAVDLLNVALAVYTADLRVWRGYTEDQWTRSFALYVPVTDPSAWTTAVPLLVRLASFLTGDHWEILLRERSSEENPRSTDVEPPRAHAVSLFSGGLDSFVGAIDLLSEPGTLALVGQYANSQKDQKRAYDALAAAHPDRTLPFWFHVSPSLGKDENGKPRTSEDTTRSRSLLFLALGTAIANAMEPGTPLYVPENGLISLNVPLTSSRIGSSSTRTTHPYTVRLYREILNAIGIAVPLVLPYRFVTKGQMLSNVRDPGLLASGVHATMSCSRPMFGRYRGLPQDVHCGYCVPCIIRRAALACVGMDNETRHVDILNESASPREARGVDRRAFQIAIQRIADMSPFRLASEVLSSGPIPDADVDGSIVVFRRGIDEVSRFFAGTR
jgi:hypothetical protein